ncbi:MAG: glutamate-5-semialdehyde dehydrogenase [Pseudanabaenaceae cyanobacterium]
MVMVFRYPKTSCEFLPVSLLETVRAARRAAQVLAQLSTAERDCALLAVATALEAAQADILAANAADMAAAADLPKALQARLELKPSKMAGMAAGVRDVARLPDPLNQRQIHRELDEGLILERRTCPLGTIAAIFEARPDAVPQIASLAIKSGNGAILKGGKEATHSCAAIFAAIRQGLAASAVPPDALQLIATREETVALLALDRELDLIVPRGSNEFVRYIQDHTRIAVLGHADGICHLYIDGAADREKAIALAVDAKTQYPAACNAIETLLVDAAIAPALLPSIAQALTQQGVELRGDDQARKLYPMNPATAEDWATEYCDLILAVKVVDGLEEALAHIQTYGSRHTEAIVTENAARAETFLNTVDAAGVYWNCSTRFADGFRYGFGAEVGISTQKLPPRGPVGLEGLVTYKYRLVGQGQTVASYTGPNARAFRHRDLPL